MQARILNRAIELTSEMRRLRSRLRDLQAELDGLSGSQDVQALINSADVSDGGASGSGPPEPHYLKTELYQLVGKDTGIFDFLLRSSLDGLFYVDLQNQTDAWMSPEYKKLFGFEEHEVPNSAMWWQENIFPEDLGPALNLFQRHLADPTVPYDITVRYRHKNGSTVWVRCRGIVVRDGEGCPIRMVGSHTDVSAMKKTEERLRTVIQSLPEIYHFRQLAETLPYLIWEVNTDGGTTYMNREFRDYTGKSPASLAATTLSECFHPDDAERINALWRNGQVSGEIEAHQVRLRSADGRYRWFLNRLTPVRDETGTLLHWVGSGIDIHDQKLAEEGQRRSEERFRKLVESNVVGIVISSPTRVVEANQYFLELVGATAEQLHRGQLDWRILTAPEDRHTNGRVIQQLMESGSCQPFEKRYLRSDGVRVPVLVGSTLLDLAPEPRFLSLVVDLTERKRWEEQFHQAQRLESIGQLAGGVAHDFNNLLTIIAGYSQMLVSDGGNEDLIRDAAEQISRAAERASELTHQLLTFSRHQPSEPRNVGMNDLVRSVEKMLRRLIGEDIKLQLQLAPDAGVVFAEPGRIEQVIVNLAVNARDAMPEGGRLLIETNRIHADEQFAAAHVLVPEGHYAELTVTDTGVGMTPEVRARIFEPFYTTKEVGRGTGLGLSTVYGIVKQCGGSIWVYSEPGMGSTFRVLLPLAAETCDVPEAPVTAPLEPGSGTILVVEDEDGVRRFVHEVLERHGYRVVETADPLEALDLLRDPALVVDLLLTDMVMPNLSGVDLARQALELRPDLVVLQMSGYADRVWRSDVVQHAYLQKPFTPSALLQQIRGLLEKPEPPH